MLRRETVKAIAQQAKAVLYPPYSSSCSCSRNADWQSIRIMENHFSCDDF
jgi:hypothetical protein